MAAAEVVVAAAEVVVVVSVAQLEVVAVRCLPDPLSCSTSPCSRRRSNLTCSSKLALSSGLAGAHHLA